MVTEGSTQLSFVARSTPQGLSNRAATVYVISPQNEGSGMAPTYRAERDRGSKEFPQQLVVLRERWPLAFPTNLEDVRPLAMGAARQVAATAGWSCRGVAVLEPGHVPLAKPR
jgi:hypothetical protein